ncbi:hypothetical protein [Pseudoxanthomonas suwonensis]|uniref:RNA polymerase, sigma-24 subunit, ECF subfamily n=1 Tax=Pseudoxanthomonas suwonensis TaxID=314722 RepID=A0A0E3UMA4_9GAMM|nr:hypothetical protein [Pseudoxanthomonas suwonensis]AKC86166.1 hypothetical protein WQ53_04625 [Pseudoxanthomonas suwonensis]
MTETRIPEHPAAVRFADTRWTLVGTAARGERLEARRALLELCLQYWYPVYAYLRRCGHAPLLAEDIACAFFRDLVHSRLPLASVPTQTRFRDFLLESLHHFLATDWRRMENPGGPADALQGPAIEDLEARHRRESPAASASLAFHRGYALELIASAHRRLSLEAAHAGRGPMYQALAPFLATPPEPGTLESLAQRLSTRPLVLAIALKRLRQRFQELVHDELAQTVSDAAGLERERLELLAVLQ